MITGEMCKPMLIKEIKQVKLQLLELAKFEKDQGANNLKCKADEEVLAAQFADLTNYLKELQSKVQNIIQNKKFDGMFDVPEPPKPNIFDSFTKHGSSQFEMVSAKSLTPRRDADI